MKNKKDSKKEIEVKIQPSLSQITTLKGWLKSKNIKGTVTNIKDWYFDTSTAVFLPFKSFYRYDATKGFIDVLEYVRVRRKNGTWIKCHKKRLVGDLGETIAVEEKEEAVDKQEISRLKSKGYEVKAEIEKTRTVFLVNETFEVAIDEIKKVVIDGEEPEINLPAVFIEVEHKKEHYDAAKGMNELYDFLKLIGFKNIKQFDRGYICIFLNPRYDFTEDVKL